MAQKKSFSAALLVFLPGPAGAWIVAPHLRRFVVESETDLRLVGDHRVLFELRPGGGRQFRGLVLRNAELPELLAIL